MSEQVHIEFRSSNYRVPVTVLCEPQDFLKVEPVPEIRIAAFRTWINGVSIDSYFPYLSGIRYD